MAPPPAMTKPGSIASALRWSGLLAILIVAAMRCMARFSPMLVFDSDPALDATPLDGFSPAGSLALDAVLLLGVGLALAGEIIAGRRVAWRWLILAAVPLPVVLWHGAHEAEHLWRGLTWGSGALAAVAVAHLARDAAMRRVTLAVLLAVLVPLIARGAMQVTVEHQQMIEQFEAQREAFFQARGWEPDGSNARIYERRLRQPQPLGWFMTTNIFASLLAAAAGALIALAAHARPAAGAFPLARVALALGAVSCAAFLWLTDSKGAMLAGLAGGGLLAALALGRRWFAPLDSGAIGRIGGVVTVGLLAAAIGAIAIRGAVLDEDFAGDRSLLFRWHYIVASAGVIGENPAIGVGPGGYQDAYMLHRVPRNPEEVTSAHNVLADWLAMLGVAGAAWAVLLIGQTWRIGSGMARAAWQPGGGAAEDEAEDATAAPCAGNGASTVPRSTLYLAAGIALAAAVPALLTELHTLSDLDHLARMGGLAGLLAAILGLIVLLQRLPGRAVTLAAGAGAIVLAMHGQIEMTFYQPGSVIWAMLLLAVAMPAGAGGGEHGGEASRSGADHPAGGGTRRLFEAGGGGGASAVLAIAVLVLGAWPARQQQAMLIDAAARLAAPTNTSREVVEQRLAAAEAADDAAAAWPIHQRIARVGPRQRLIAAGMLGEDGLGLLDQVIEETEHGWQRFGRTAWLGLSREAADARAQITGSEAHWRQAITWAERLTQRDPYGVGSWLALADTSWRAGEREAARAAYQRVLENNRQFELDPLRQLSDEQQARVESRLDAHAEP